ncbi:MAG: phasin family protein [Azospirillum sp.]|nr:phasin family protein [Azospirillum sp.]
MTKAEHHSTQKPGAGDAALPDGLAEFSALQRAMIETAQELLTSSARFGIRRISAVSDYAAQLTGCKSPAEVASANVVYLRRYLGDVAEQAQEVTNATNGSLAKIRQQAAQ